MDMAEFSDEDEELVDEEELEEQEEEEQEDDSISEEERPSRSPTDRLEDLVASFLFQLASDPSSSAVSGDASTDRDEREPKAKPAPLQLRVADRRSDSGALRTMRYPAKRAKGSALPFAQLFKVLDLMHAAVVDDVPATKRDIYYKDVPLFGKQRVVDNLVDDLAATLELERSDLNVRATSKGLVCGSGLTIHLVSGEEVHANDTEGALIPVKEDIAGFTMGEDVEWVLIVEKDAVFQTLCRLRLTDHEALSGRGIMITGKGYPDVATRQLVTSLAEGLPKRIPILGLVDGDPYGLDILATYKYGSRGMKHEGGLAAGRVKYVGVFASELGSYGVDRDALLPITKHDEKKALAMLSRPLPAKWRKELSHMLHSRRKAEIEILEGGGLLRYLVAKISKYAGE